MHDGPTNSRLLFAGRAVGLAACAWIALTSPAVAAETNYKAFFLALDYAQTQPNGLDQHFATHVDASTNPVLDERLVIDNSSAATGRASLGYRFGGNLGSLQVSYWSFDNDDAQEGLLKGGVYPTVAGYTYGGGMYIYNASGVRFQATSEVKAETTDLDYVRTTPMSSTFSMKWIAGLRAARYEETQSFAANDGAMDFFQDKHFKTRGAGPRVGLAGLFGITKHFHLEGSLAVSFLQATTEGVATATFPTGSIQMIRGEDNNVWGNIQDYDLSAVWRFPALDYYLGYSDSVWSGVPGDPVPAGGCCSASLSPAGRSRQTVSFNGLHTGVVLRFGRTK